MPENKPDDRTVVTAIGHILIKDKDTGEVLVDQFDNEDLESDNDREAN